MATVVFSDFFHLVTKFPTLFLLAVGRASLKITSALLLYFFRKKKKNFTDSFLDYNMAPRNLATFGEERDIPHAVVTDNGSKITRSVSCREWRSFCRRDCGTKICREVYESAAHELYVTSRP